MPHTWWSLRFLQSWPPRGGLLSCASFFVQHNLAARCCSALPSYLGTLAGFDPVHALWRKTPLCVWITAKGRCPTAQKYGCSSSEVSVFKQLMFHFPWAPGVAIRQLDWEPWPLSGLSNGRIFLSLSRGPEPRTHSNEITPDSTHHSEFQHKRYKNKCHQCPKLLKRSKSLTCFILLHLKLIFLGTTISEKSNFSGHNCFNIGKLKKRTCSWPELRMLHEMLHGPSLRSGNFGKQIGKRYQTLWEGKTERERETEMLE